MNMISAIKSYLKKTPFTTEKPAAEAYDIWSGSYDSQPGNLMLDLDETIFTNLVATVNLENKTVADIGCGTGRHWQKLYEKKPAQMMGFDVSAGMLDQLKRKFPGAFAIQTSNNLLNMVPDTSVSCVVSTLTIAHIENIDEAIATWTRILKNNGDLLITDFHPATLANGGVRSFRHDGRQFSVLNHIHPLETVKKIFNDHGLTLVRQTEEYIDQKVKHYYEAQNALCVYNRFLGMPIIYGLHLKKTHGT